MLKVGLMKARVWKKESEVGEASDLSVDKEDPGSRVKSSEKIIKKK